MNCFDSSLIIGVLSSTHHNIISPHTQCITAVFFMIDNSMTLFCILKILMPHTFKIVIAVQLPYYI